MPYSKNEKSEGIIVKVTCKTGEERRGIMFYHEEGPHIKFNSSDILRDTGGVMFSFQGALLGKIGAEFEIYLEPEVVVELEYSPSQISRFQMYPPSSDSWLRHVLDGGTKSIFTVQRIRGSKKKLLTIVDKNSKKLHFVGMIRSYESAILSMKRDWNVLNDIIYSDLYDTDIYDILKGNSLSWSALSKLVEGVNIPDLVRYDTMEETLSQLVPKSFPMTIRKQIMAFLGWLDSAEIPEEDPIDFAMKYRSVPVFRALARGHIQCLLDDVDPPKYVHTLLMAEKGQLDISRQPQPEAAELDLWNTLRAKLQEVFPSWMGRAVSNAIALQNNGRVVTELPVTREDARSSRDSWGDRFALVDHTLFMRGHVHKNSIGLTPVVYIGAAHRWPHKHLEWSARLGYSSEKPQYIQVMVMPSSAFEQVSRIIPSIQPIDWEMSSFNLSLYNKKARKWNLKTSMILKSIDKKRSIRQLSNEFGSWKGKNYYQLSQSQTRILDLISWGFYLSSLETDRYSQYSGFSNYIIKQELDMLQKEGVFLLQFFLIPEKLRSICIIVEGPSHNVCSLARAFLKYVPSTQVRISDGGTWCTIVSRVPEDEHYHFAISLTEAARESELSIQAYPISAYSGYRNDMYSRLMNQDGSWDDDVSGLLDQVRLRHRE